MRRILRLPLIAGLVLALGSCATGIAAAIVPAVDQRYYDDVLRNEILSWNGCSADSLIDAWGIPNDQYSRASGERLYVYSAGDSSTATRGAMVSAQVKDGRIASMSYEGQYAQLRKLCKSPSPLYGTRDEDKAAARALEEAKKDNLSAQATYGTVGLSIDAAIDTGLILYLIFGLV